MMAKDPVQPGDGDPRHGTDSTYQNHACRCELCRQAHLEAQRVGNISRAARLDSLPPEAHGKLSTYRNWSCRCDLCRDAQNEYQRNKRNSPPRS